MARLTPSTRFIKSLTEAALVLSLITGVVTPAGSQEQDSILPRSPAEKPVEVQRLKATLSKTQTLQLTLEDALQMALDDSPVIQAAAQQVSQARARYLTRLAEMIPSVGFGLGYAQINAGNFTVKDTVINARSGNILPQAVFSFPVFQGGRKWFPMKAARKSLDAQKAVAEGQTQVTLQNTALAFYNFKRALAQLAVAEQQVIESKSLLDLNRSRLEVGSGTRLDVLQSEAQVARAGQALLEAEKNAEISALSLNELLNLPYITAPVVDQSANLQTLVSETQSTSALIETAVANRPEIRQIDKQIASFQDLAKLVWAAYMPEVKVQARTGAVGTSLDDLREYNLVNYAVSFNFEHLGVNALTLYKENAARIAELRSQRDNTIRRIEREVVEAVLTSKTTQSQLAVSDIEVAACRQALSDSKERFEAGLGRNQDVLEAQTQLVKAQTAYHNTVLAFNQAQVNLLAALGLVSVKHLTQGVATP